MTLAAGTKLGPYEIQSPLGAGGMGEVYRARDSRLNRTVAIKILPSHLSDSPEAKQRFDREAQAISSLNDPNICTLYDVGSQAGVDFLVMEFLEGETLADRLRKGSLPPELASKYGIEICDGLERAHRSGLVHRDLKPGNIMLTKTGVKLMDFGLAKSMPAKAPPSSGMDATLSRPAGNSPLTEKGMVVGTFQYMSPEQVQGKEEADARSDIFSLGAVLYEMVTGQRAFEGKSQLSVAAAILEKEPAPVSSVKPMTPPALDHAIRCCLDKDPEQRWQTARDLALELSWVAEGASASKTFKPVARIRERIAWGLGAVCLALLIWVSLARFRSTPAPPHRQLRLSLLPPQATSFVANNFAISPDGKRLAFVAAGPNGETSLWIRSLAASTAQRLTGTEASMEPFWSGDSRQIGFFAEGKLKTVDPSSGAIQIVCDTPPAIGATWNSHGVIVFSAGLLYKVAASGGSPVPVTKPIGSQQHHWPSFLPDGDHFLYFAENSQHSEENTAGDGIYVGSITSMESKMISAALLSNTEFASGRLFFVRDRSLMAQPLDLQRLQLAGTSEVIAPQELELDPASLRAGFSVSEDGVVVFQSAADNASRLSWFDRAGKELEIIPAVGYRDPSLSHNGTRLAVSSDDEHNGKLFIRIYDFVRGTSSRVSESGVDVFPVMSPDSKTVAYGRGDANSIYTVAADNSTKPGLLIQGQHLIPNDWSSDGRYLLYMNFQHDLPELDFYDFRKHSQTPYTIGAEAQFSPDGMWVAFTVGTGRSSGNYQDSEIVVASFPGPGARLQISNHGGAQPRWRADGKELFYMSLDKKLMAVSIDTTHGKLVAGVPHALFQTRIIASRIVLFQYAVSPDGKRFLINSLPSVGAAPLTVLIN